MKTPTDENYLKEIYELALDRDLVTTSMLASRLGCAAATVTGRLKKLAQMKWVKYSPYRGVCLTRTGRDIALEVVRHHRLIETYLARELGVPWDRVHAEAEELEHVISEYLENRIDEVLHHPSVDPHGSPIPGRDGTMKDYERTRLSDLPVRSRAEIVEVYDRDPVLLEHIDRLGLHPGTQVFVSSIEPVDGLISLEVRGPHGAANPVIIGTSSASRLIVKVSVSDDQVHEV